jgi:enoyl-CoA hydratase
MNITGLFERRSVLKAGAVLGGLSAVLARAPAAGAVERDGGEAVADDVKMAEIPLSSAAKVTVERRGQIVLIGLNRPYIHNRVDPETYGGLAAAYSTPRCGPPSCSDTATISPGASMSMRSRRL